MLNQAQSVLSRILPEALFERLYRVAARLYEETVRLEDWAYYHRIVTNSEERTMIETVKQVLPYTMVGRKGLIATYQAVMDIEKRRLGGCFVECGVARGGSAALMMLASDKLYPKFYNDRQMFLFDSFQGLPPPTEEDGFLRNPRSKDRTSNDLTTGHCLGAIGDVHQILFDRLQLSPLRVRLVKGWFQDTLPIWRDHIGKTIAVLRIDGDWYESTKCCLENLYDCVVDGGYVIIDDYALVGCRKAVDEFFEKREEVPPEVTEDGRGGGYFIKEERN